MHLDPYHKIHSDLGQPPAYRSPDNKSQSISIRYYAAMPLALIPLCHPLRTCSHASLHRYLPLHDMVTGHKLKTVPPRDADVASKLPNFAETLRFSHRQKLNGHFMEFRLSWACNLDWMRRSAAADGLVDRPRFMRVCLPWPWKTSQPAMIWKVQWWQCWPQFVVYLPFALTQQWSES